MCIYDHIVVVSIYQSCIINWQSIELVQASFDAMVVQKW